MNLIPYRYRNNLARPEVPSLFDDFFRPFFGGEQLASFRVDVKDEGDKYLLEADLPGAKRDDVSIAVNDGTLTITAEWNSEKKDDKGRGYIMHERRSGKACRSFALDNVREDEISAEYKDGVLRLTLPKVNDAEKAPRRIEIQ